MSQLVGVVLGLTVLLAIVGAIGTWVVGSVLYYTPGQMERGQQVLRRGADASFLALCVASVIYAVARKAETSPWAAVGVTLVMVLVAFGVPWMWKRFRNKQT